MGRNRNVGPLYAVAQDMMDRTKAMERIAKGLPVEGESFRRAFLGLVQGYISPWNPGTLAEIIVLGCGVHPNETSTRATLYEVGLGKSFNKRMDGWMSLRTLAGLAIVAAMLDLARIHVNKKGADAKIDADP